MLIFCVAAIMNMFVWIYNKWVEAIWFLADSRQHSFDKASCTLHQRVPVIFFRIQVILRKSIPCCFSIILVHFQKMEQKPLRQRQLSDFFAKEGLAIKFYILCSFKRNMYLWSKQFYWQQIVHGNVEKVNQKMRHQQTVGMDSYHPKPVSTKPEDCLLNIGG